MHILSVFDMYGSIKLKILAEREFNNDKRKIVFFNRVKIKSDQIITTYLGEEKFVFKEGSSPRGKEATKFLFFDFYGNFIKVIEAKHEIYDFTIDEENKPVFFPFCR
ncbi:hypothetical protein MM239_05880 [Belliella sp. DSM 111904]|uniref:Uncharacterized protein n=1 Tax=Belliella filtrata TaxID=2923435 RepID=A0ABS9UY87_9BACT|nr:hypothetical protein [Belliella filtrata]MCH7408915.1 hypothetical protein [Belliella filtrata]